MLALGSFPNRYGVNRVQPVCNILELRSALPSPLSDNDISSPSYNLFILSIIKLMFCETKLLHCLLNFINELRKYRLSWFPATKLSIWHREVLFEEGTSDFGLKNHSPISITIFSVKMVSDYLCEQNYRTVRYINQFHLIQHHALHPCKSCIRTHYPKENHT